MTASYPGFFSLSIFLLLCLPGNTFGQDCSNEALTAKYWQYRDNFNRHFILIDRDPDGCVHDGIGQHPQDQCSCTKYGYSLPATSINQESNGGSGMGDRNESGSIWYDPDCVDDDGDPATPGTSWEHQEKHNFLEMGPETPHQMGWHWAMLATEYALLKKNGQLDEAQRTLEELFLGLQAYRRLDIRANCLAADRYREITEGFEASDNCSPQKACLCGIKYQGKTTRNFDSPCDKNCPFTPNTSGYSGFFIREDATQDLERLHDFSEDRWNIDAVGSAYAMALKPPCITTFSPACYTVHRQNFMSQDGVIGLMIGLATVKRFIPENVSIYTCEGEQYFPHQMAVKIASAMVNRIDNTWLDKISWPGSYQCCEKEVFFSEHDGGVATATMHGLKKAASYIDDAGRHSDVAEVIAWHGLTEQTRKLIKGHVVSLPFFSMISLLPLNFGNNANFWIRLKTLGWEMGGAGKNSLYREACENHYLEIMPMLNNLLYPLVPNLKIDREFFKRMLCEAPCGGPCKQQQGYPNSPHPDHWPVYSCPNHPEWLGQRWEAHDGTSRANRQFNGLDYMALYNIYMLHFPEEQTPYYNPARPDLSADHLLGEQAIKGPLYVCPGEEATYELQTGNEFSGIEALNWTSSEHFSISHLANNAVTVKFQNPAASGRPYISAKFKELRQLDQYYSMTLGHVFPGLVLLPFDPATKERFPKVPDGCTFTYYQPIRSAALGYQIETELDHCAGDYHFQAVGAPGETYEWVIRAEPADTSLAAVTVSGSGQAFNYTHPRFPGNKGQLRISLTVKSDCGEFHTTNNIPYKCSGASMNMRVDPNPTQDNISVNLFRSDGTPYDIPPDGVDVLIVPANGGKHSLKSKLYPGSRNIKVAELPGGVYNVVIFAPDLAPLGSTLVIIR